MFAVALIVGVIVSIVLVAGPPRSGLFVVLLLASTSQAAIRTPEGVIINPYTVEPGKPLIDPKTVPPKPQREPARAMLIPTEIHRSPSVRSSEC